MPDARLLADGALGLVAAALFAYASALNARRPTHDGHGWRATRQFSAWWIGLAAYTLAGAARSLLAALGVLDPRVHVALEALGYAPLCVALWGLLSYLLYIYEGSHRRQTLLRAYHAGLLLGLLAVLAWTRPNGVVVGEWTTRLAYARPLEGLPLVALVLLILGPVIGGAVLYGGLYPRTRDPLVRRRILLVSAALASWFGLSALGTLVAQDLGWWPLAARGLALASTLLLVAAFHGVGRPARRALPA